MKKRSLQLLILITCLAVSTLAQINLDAPIPSDPSVRAGKLENGLTYYIKRNMKPEKKGRAASCGKRRFGFRARGSVRTSPFSRAYGV